MSDQSIALSQTALAPAAPTIPAPRPVAARTKLLLEGRFAPKSVIPVEVDPIRAPGVFKFEASAG